MGRIKYFSRKLDKMLRMANMAVTLQSGGEKRQRLRWREEKFHSTNL